MKRNERRYQEVNKLYHKIVELHITSGLTIKELAEMYGKTPQCVNGWMASHGIKNNSNCLTPGKGRKKCSICKMIVKEDKFAKGQTRCNDCANKLQKSYRKRHAKKYKEYELKRKDNPNRMLSNLKFNLKRSVGITPKDRVALMDKQKGCCDICGSSLINPKFHQMDLNVDHNHTTGKTRGLLCGKCNTALGSFRDSKENLSKAIEYLAKYEEHK